MRPFIAFIAFIAFPLSAHAAPPGPIIISELMWMGSTRSSADEWIDLYNRGDAIVDLSGWTLTRLSGDEDQIMLTFAGGTVAPGQTFLIANYTAKHENSRLAVQSQYVAPAVSTTQHQTASATVRRQPARGRKTRGCGDDGRGTPFRGDASLKQAMVRIAFNQGGDNPKVRRRRPSKAAGMMVPPSWVRRVRFPPTSRPTKRLRTRRISTR